MRTIALLCALGAPLFAAILPDEFAGQKKQTAKAVAVSDRPLWEEYGLKETEQAQYGAFTATAYRFLDTTGAMAAFEWQRPADARKSSAGELAVETPDGALVAHGNYLLRFEGLKPSAEQLLPLLSVLPKLEKSQLPLLPGYLPQEGLVANSERYVLGPASLQRFQPQVRPSVAALHYSTEAIVGRYQAGGGETDLAVYSYPTPQIARERVEEFRKIPGAMVKRTGPLIALIVSPPDADAAERLLGAVRYEAEVTMTEYVPTRRDNIGHLILTIFALIGVLLLFAIAAGLAVGGVRSQWRKWLGRPEPEDPMILLHLSGPHRKLS